MIRLALRLTVAGGRDAFTRLALIAIAVAVGTGLLLTTVASLNAVTAQNGRYAWLETGYSGSNAPAATTPAAGATADPLWWRLRADYYQGRQIGRVDLAATGPTSPVPPGIAALPGPGQYYASPALASLLRRTPAAQLGDRYPGTLVGTIGASALPAPNSLLIVIGHSPAELAHQEDVREVARISTTVPSSCNGDCALGVGTNGNGITLILAVVAAALLFPVLIFIGGATRLSAARREQRFAAMRLVGATPGQISTISTVESSVATVLGVVAGFGLFYALRPKIATIPFTGDPFFTGDLSLSAADVLLVALGIPVAAALAARLALRRVTISPLGVSRHVTPRPPRAWRVLPLLAGVGELGYFAYVRDIGATSHTNTTVEAVVFLAGVLMVMAGLVIAGPWLTMLASRVSARHAKRPATLIAARRLADNPQAGFRAISGVVLAVFVGTCAIGIITAVTAQGGTPTADASLHGGTRRPGRWPAGRSDHLDPRRDDPADHLDPRCHRPGGRARQPRADRRRPPDAGPVRGTGGWSVRCRSMRASRSSRARSWPRSPPWDAAHPERASSRSPPSTASTSSAGHRRRRPRGRRWRCRARSWRPCRWIRSSWAPTVRRPRWNGRARSSISPTRPPSPQRP